MSGICDTCKRRNVCRKPIGGIESCRLYVSGKESNYEKLFGTPERAAQTLKRLDEMACKYCLLHDHCGGSCLIYMKDDALLKWLKQEVNE